MAITHIAKPRVACEITPERVIAARANDARSMVETSSVRALPPGSLVPSLVNDNLAQRDTVARAVSEALAAVAGRSRDVVIVIPDAAVRVFLLDFETLPEKTADAEAVVRFRLKKSLPFDSDKAAVSYQRQSANGTLQVMTAVALPGVIEEYQGLFRSAGYNPGVVVPSMLGALGMVDADRPTLLLKADQATTSVAVVDNEQVRLFRTVENPRGIPLDNEQLAEEVYPSLVFFQDTYGVKVERILVAGVVGSQQLATVLREQTGARVEELTSGAYVDRALEGDMPRTALSAVVGALLG